MTKTSTRGGLLTRALSCGCAVALAASLAPAAGVAWAAAGDAGTASPLPTIPGNVDVKVNVGTMVNKAYTPFATATVNVASLASSGAQNATMYWGASTWEVAATKNFVPLTDILKAAGMEGYWDADASLNYQDDAEANFKPYATVTGGAFYPGTGATTNTASSSSATSEPVPAGVALNVFTSPVGGDVNYAVDPTNSVIASSSAGSTAGDTRKLMYEGLTANAGNGIMPTSTQVAGPAIFMAGLSQGAYQSRWDAGTAGVLGATSAINILVGGPQYVSRIYGQDWADTMVQALNSTFTTGKGNDIVLATADNYQDALAASGLAGALKCPIVMTSGEGLTKQAGDYLQKFLKATVDGASNPAHIYVIGGEVAIKETVLDQIKRLPDFYGKQASAATGSTGGLWIQRIYGDEAWDTSLEIRKAMANTAIVPSSMAGAGKNDVIIACSGGYQDAMSIAPYAYKSGTPVVLTDNTNMLSNDAVKELNATNKVTGKVNIIGGPAVVSDKVPGQLISVSSTDVFRTFGQSAYDTSNQVATLLVGSNARFGSASFATPAVACFATGENYLDALASAAYCGTKGQPLLLVSNSDETTVNGFLANNAKVTNNGSVVTATIFGGTGVLGEKVATDINQVLKSN